MMAGAMLLNAVFSGVIPKCTAFPLMAALYFLAFFAFANLKSDHHVLSAGALTSLLAMLLAALFRAHLGSVALAHVVGSVAGGFLLDAFRRPVLMMAGAMLLNAVLNGTVPLCTSFPVMNALYFLINMALAVIDVVSNSELAKLWPGGDGTFMQALHFCFSFGAILSPLATQRRS
nr:hypothetical protein BaRGS_018395 [Batillaria attramentaria]